jgi:hypothetical protein
MECLHVERKFLMCHHFGGGHDRGSTWEAGQYDLCSTISKAQ